jgi:predicted acylesterase/phospholipase RssA
VLKGGITSGVVYPLAICEIATHFQLKQLGGTSAGAIAAALAAAAERGRHVPGAGFMRLAAIPDKLVETKTDLLADGTKFTKTYDRTKLMRLFQPHPSLQLLFRSLLRLMNLSSFWQLPKTKNKFLETIFGMMKLELVFTSVFTLLGSWVCEYIYRHKLHALLCLLVSSVLVVAVPLELLATVIWVPLAAVAVTLALIAYSFFKIMPDQHFGMCGGTSTSKYNDQGLTDWLHDELNLAAHGAARKRPLTFGELWYGPDTKDTRDESHSYTSDSQAPPFANIEDRYVDLNLLTTCASHGRSYKLPLSDVTLQLFFDPRDMQRLIPQTVANWMVNHSPEHLRSTAEGHDLYAMPPMADWPVVLAVRLSLSFPVMFSMVRFYAEPKKPLNAREYTGPVSGLIRLAPIWFTDGGLASNFPIHLFDDPIPPWPTFAINLTGLEEGDRLHPSDDTQNIEYYRAQNDDRPLNLLPVNTMPSFFGRLLDTMQNWSDNSLTNMIGYRERIVHVKLAPDEGGMNLNMDPETISRLTERGWAAGRLLVDRFAEQNGTAWQEHYRDRIGIAVGGVQKWIKAFAEHYDPTTVNAQLGILGQTPAEVNAAITGLENINKIHAIWVTQPFPNWLYTRDQLAKIAVSGLTPETLLELRNRTSA